MDRNKAVSRGTKSKINAAPSNNELYVLGTKPCRDDKSHIFALKGSNTDRKREASSSYPTTVKKNKCVLSSQSCSLFEEVLSTRNFVTDSRELKIIENDPSEHMTRTFLSIISGDSQVVIGALHDHIRFLLQSFRGKNDDIINIFLLYLAKVRPNLICDELVTGALVPILHRDVVHTFKNKTNTIQILVANALYCGFASKSSWPEDFLRCYIDDAINERLWVDSELCSLFTQNISFTFRTIIPPKSIVQIENECNNLSLRNADDVLIPDERAEAIYKRKYETVVTISFGNHNVSFFLKDRYLFHTEKVEKLVTDAVKEHLNKRQDCYTKNFMRFLCTTSGIADVRMLSTSRLEFWIHNGKLMKAAQELLCYIFFNITSRPFKDQEVLASLVKMRLKTKPLINFYMTCLKESISLNPTILPVVLKLILQNELSNARNPNNMGILATLFQAAPIESARSLADIYKEILLQKEDYLRTLRVFLRELVRILRFDINLVEFCKVFLNGRCEFTLQIQQLEYKDRIFHSTVDITCLCMFLAITPQIREMFISIRSGRDIENNQTLLNFYLQISQIQLDAISWMYSTVPSVHKPHALEYNQALHKLLLLESPENYSRCDQWPSEPERSSFLRIVSETPISEDTLLRIILIGITQDVPFTVSETFDVLVSVIKRASSQRNTDVPAVQANKFEIIDFLFGMAEYHYPEKIDLPNNYDPPKLAVTLFYWKAWIVLLMISAHNPSTFGAFCWDHYPTMKMLMEMCITNTITKDHTMTKEELQISTLERERILEFEAYLAAHTLQAVITEENSILASQVMLMDPMGPARRVPPTVLEQLRNLNQTLKLGNLLCRSRKPDLLLQIIHRQGTSQSMPWLSNLVQNSDGEFRHLPVQCLCEFLLSNVHTFSEENNRNAKLISYLRKLITEENSDKSTVCEILDYMFRRLSSTVKQCRISAYSGLKLLFKGDENWLLISLPQILYFKGICSFIISQLRSACQVENVPELVMCYIQFVAAHSQNDPVSIMLDHVIDMAQLIVERNTMFHYITSGSLGQQCITTNVYNVKKLREETLKCLFVMFNNYIIKLREHQDSYEWTQYPDLVMVEFGDGIQLPIHLNIIHAFIILLTHSTNEIPESIPILDYWFPLGRTIPRAYFPDLPNERVQFLPDWLKLKMIRSPVERLIVAALGDLSPDQIVLFVQNFGTPVLSMSKLLALLDHAVIEQFEAVRNAILNRAYLAQLIEIQQGRGAKNGHITVQALELYSHSQTVPDLHKVPADELECIDCFQITGDSSPDYSLTRNQADNYAENIIVGSQEDMSTNSKFRKLIYHMLHQSGVKLKNYYNSSEINEYILCLVKKTTERTSFQGIFNKHACTLIRALLVNRIETSEKRNVLNDINTVINSVNKSELLKIQNMTLLAVFQKQIELIQNKDQVKKIYPLDKNSINQTLLKIHQHKYGIPNVRLESFENESAKVLFDNIINTFQISSNNSKDYLGRSAKYTHYGILVDWLEIVDPELITVNISLQISLMFSKPYTDFCFYMLSLLCHETNWNTLNHIVNYLLNKFRTEFNQSAILNFIDALFNNPRLWKGRDISISKNFKRDIAWVLDNRNMQVLTQYILIESELEDLLLNHTQYCDKLSSRIDLLYQISNKNPSIFISCLDYAFKCSCSTSLTLKFIQQLYMMYPKIKYLKETFNETVISKLQNPNGFRSDKVANNLITCLGNLFSKKDFESIFSDLDLLMRKLAASHPTLFLRQLGAFCSQIQGKAHVSIRALRDEYHIKRFIQLLRIFEFLQPMIFYDEYKVVLQQCLDCYFTFFKYHMREKETYQIAIKFVEFLHAYIKKNPSSAFIYIEKYTFILQKMATKFSFLIKLQQLVQGLSLLKYKSMISNQLDGEVRQEFDLYDGIDIQNESGVILPLESEVFEQAVPQLDIESKLLTTIALPDLQKQTFRVSSNVSNLIQIIKRSSSEEIILGPLQEIEGITSKRFSLLHEIFDRLLDLIFSPSTQIRSHAYILLIRHLKNHTGRTDIIRCTFNAFVQCLCNDNSSVSSTAVDNLVEMTILLQEYCTEILGVAFSLGIKSKISTNSQVKRAMQTLMLQQGC